MRRTVTLSGAVFALLCLAMILFALPAGAQPEVRGIPAGAPARVVDTGDNNPRGVILVAARDCTVLPDASITLVTLEEDEGVEKTFTNGGNIKISAPNGRPRIEGSADDEAFDTDRDYEVVSSTGITCGDEDENTSSARVQYIVDGEVDKAKDVIIGTTSKKKIPNTGGPPLLLFGALLLGAAVVVGRRVLRP